MARIRRITTTGQGVRYLWLGRRSEHLQLRAADFTILMGFQEDFGDQAPDEFTQTMVLEGTIAPPQSRGGQYVDLQ